MTEEKILKEENLSEDELAKVAGGNWNEINEDAKRFKELNVPIYGADGEGGPMVAPDLLTGSLTKAFEKHGVTYVRSFADENQYYINGKKVSQAEAWKYIYSKLNK